MKDLSTLTDDELLNELNQRSKKKWVKRFSLLRKYNNKKDTPHVCEDMVCMSNRYSILDEIEISVDFLKNQFVVSRTGNSLYQHPDSPISLSDKDKLDNNKGMP